MRKLMFCALLATSLTAMAQTEVSPYTPGVNAEGVTYMLPRTLIKVDVLVEGEHYTPGEYAKYAERYLRLPNVQTDQLDTYTIKDLHLDVLGKPDTTKVFTVKLKDKTIAPMVKLSESGLLLAINAPASEYETFKGFEESKSGKMYNSRDFMTEEILMAGSTAKTAELCAQEIYNIRESKNSLNRGQADFMPTDGKQMEIMVNNLNEQEAALMQMFTGYTLKETKAYTFYIDPSADIKKQILFRFSQRLGLVDKDDLSGTPIYFDVTDQHTVPSEPVIVDKKPKKLTGVQYTLPSKAKVAIYDAKNKMLDAEIAVAQFGNVETLDSSLFNKKLTTKITFFDVTGGIKSIEAE
ncbi:MAG: DUF4831 family protein [Bacteroidaceae bacterium]|nr:DUF4831 family protein [Bacteroidaceae bacterium]